MVRSPPNKLMRAEREVGGGAYRWVGGWAWSACGGGDWKARGVTCRRQRSCMHRSERETEVNNYLRHALRRELGTRSSKAQQQCKGRTHQQPGRTKLVGIQLRMVESEASQSIYLGASPRHCHGPPPSRRSGGRTQRGSDMSSALCKICQVLPL